MSAFDLEDHELTVAEVQRNPPVGALYEHAIRCERDASIADMKCEAGASAKVKAAGPA